MKIPSVSLLLPILILLALLPTVIQGATFERVHCYCESRTHIGHVYQFDFSNTNIWWDTCSEPLDIDPFTPGKHHLHASTYRCAFQAYDDMWSHNFPQAANSPHAGTKVAFKDGWLKEILSYGPEPNLEAKNIHKHGKEVVLSNAECASACHAAFNETEGWIGTVRPLCPLPRHGWSSGQPRQWCYTKFYRFEDFNIDPRLWEIGYPEGGTVVKG